MSNKAVLVCSPNWIGDAVMSMPALRNLRRRCSEASIVILTKTPLAELWTLNPDTHEILTFDDSFAGTLRAAAMLRKRPWQRAFVLPNSFRSALIPFLGGISERIGTRGHVRPGLLNHIVAHPPGLDSRHQAQEYQSLLGDAIDSPVPPPPYLTLPADRRKHIRRRHGLNDDDRLIALIPGAARGPSKRWPARHFIAAAQCLAPITMARFVVLGSHAETGLCREVADAIGPAAIDLGGQTPLPEFAAILATCQTALVNDSGGMHVAAAVGTPVVAIYGTTDPVKTGPLGQGHVIIAPDHIPRSRAIGETSEQAAQALAAIQPERVCEAAMTIIRRKQP